MSQNTSCIDDFNIFVGGKTGAFKGVKVDRKLTVVKNLQNVDVLTPENEISVLTWGNKNESEVLIGTINQLVRVYDTEFKAYSSSIETKFGSGALVGLVRINGSVTTCSESGHIKIWKAHKKELEIDTGSKVSRMRQYNYGEGIVAIGGQNNDLKVWDLEKKTKIFCAKNVKKDMLELEVPIWVSDLTFIPDNEFKVAVSTRHGHIRLYDTKAQRRPVVNICLEERALNTISLCNNPNQVIIGSATGHIMLADFRGKGNIIHTYKGAVGSIRQVAGHTDLPYVASVGLDRYLRIHHLETKKLIEQKYLKVRLNCVLMKSSYGKEDENGENEEGVECVDLEGDDEYDEIFDKMETIGNEVSDEPLKKKKKKK